jgi:hypothetical protein
MSSHIFLYALSTSYLFWLNIDACCCGILVEESGPSSAERLVWVFAITLQESGKRVVGVPRGKEYGSRSCRFIRYFLGLQGSQDHMVSDRVSEQSELGIRLDDLGATLKSKF